MLGENHLANQLLPFDDFRAVHDLFRFNGDAFGGSVNDRVQFISCRVADRELEKEAVELSLRQRISAFLFNRVLRCHHKKWFVKNEAVASNGNGAFLHGFQQGRLSFRSCTIDFIGQANLCENRTFLEFERASAVVTFHDHVCSKDIGGHQIGRELYSTEL